LKPSIQVKKSDGTYEPFQDEKLRRSLLKSGATHNIADFVVTEVAKKIKDGVSTRRIYTMAFQLLWKKSHLHAITYNLKKSVQGLGPSGFYFEQFISRVFQGKGYKTETNMVLKGHCVKHEVDIVATREDHKILMECKFHNSPSKKNDIKIVLYVQARAQDLKESKNCMDFDDFALVSNTCFSKDAIQYANCVGLKLIGFNYPEDNTISDIVKRYKLHPITCLRKLKKRYIPTLLEKGYILCKEIYRDSSILDELGIDNKEQIMKEIKVLMIS
jgi:hypothetical protein